LSSDNQKDIVKEPPKAFLYLTRFQGGIAELSVERAVTQSKHKQLTCLILKQITSHGELTIRARMRSGLQSLAQPWILASGSLDWRVWLCRFLEEVEPPQPPTVGRALSACARDRIRSHSLPLSISSIILLVRWRFRFLCRLSLTKMLFHKFSRFKRFSCANGPVDFTMHFRGFAQVAGALDGLAPLVVHRRSDGLHQRCQNWITRGL
jgi:hypothetical protein